MLRLSARPLLDNPLDAELFVGRDDELEAIGRAIHSQFNTIVQGPRGSGKTSLLRRVEQVMRERGEPVLFLDGGVAESAADLLEILEHQLFSQQDIAEAQLTRGLGRIAGRIAARPGETGRLLDLLDVLRVGHARYHARMAAAERKGVAGSAPPLEVPDRIPGVVLLDGLPSTQAGQALFGRLRDELWTVPIGWIVAVDDEQASAVLQPPADAFFEQRIRLSPLDPSAAAELIRRRIGPDESVPDSTIAEVIHHHPRQPRALIAGLRDALASEESPKQLARRRADLMSRLQEVGGRPAVALALELQQLGGASASDEYLLRRLGWTRARTSRLLHHLESEGLLTATEQRGDQGGRPRRIYSLIEPGL